MLKFETPGAAADLSQALADQGQNGAARRVLESAVARWPEHPGLWHNLGIAHQADGDWDAAIASFTINPHGSFSEGSTKISDKPNREGNLDWFANPANATWSTFD